MQSIYNQFRITSTFRTLIHYREKQKDFNPKKEQAQNKISPHMGCKKYGQAQGKLESL